LQPKGVEHETNTMKRTGEVNMGTADVGTALVLGGGGVAGIAWELGLLLGLAEAGVNVADAALVIGTSAGACVGAQITSATSLQTLYDIQLDPVASAKERAVEFDMAQLIAIFQELQLAGSGDAKTAVLARVGAMALAAPTLSEAERLDIIESRLPSLDWPDRPLLLTAVDAHTGAFVEFRSTSDVSLLHAVAASCAVPGVWPPVTIGDRRFIDGGVRSAINADLAAGSSKVLIIAPMAAASEAIEAEQRELEAAGSKVLVICADASSVAAFGSNPLDPSTRTPSAIAGRNQGAAVADEVRSFWNP
jgi:NTE family protein